MVNVRKRGKVYEYRFEKENHCMVQEERNFKTYTNEGETVLDNCMGSGSTGVACQKLNQNFIGIELDVEYYELARSRIRNEAHGKNRQY